MKHRNLSLGHYIPSVLRQAALDTRKPLARLAVLAAVGLVVFSLTPSSRAALLLTDDFTGYAGNLDGNTGGSPIGIWTKGGSGPSSTIASTTPLTYSGYSGGGNYVVMGGPSGTTSRTYKGFTSTTVAGNTFYASFLLNLTAATATGNYFITLGDPTTGTTYGPKLFAKASGSGFLLGVSKVSNTASYGTTEFSFGTTYLVVLRLTGVTGSANDLVYAWVNPSLATEPATSSAECSDATGGDTAATLGNFHWHNRSADNPSGALDAVRVAAASTSAAAWADLAASTGATAPTVTTQPASSPSTSGATLNGTVTGTGGSPLTDRGFYWKTAPGVTTSDTQLSEGGTSVATFSKALSSLSVNTIYYYRAYAANSVGTGLGNTDASFYTLANTPTAPIVGNPTAGTLDVTINGTDGNPAITTYAIKEAGGLFVQSNGVLSASAFYQAAALWAATPTVSGLSPNTPYSFTAQARNGDGVTTSFGPSTGASTLVGTVVPVVTSQAAASPTTSGATLNGTVTADGGAAITDRGFYWASGTPVSALDSQLAEGGTTVGAFSKALSGLSANTLYYYRAYAVNSVGPALAVSEASFYTLANPPVAPTVDTPTSATLNVAIGSGDANPAATVYAIQETASGNYVQTSGALGATAVYRTALAWGTKTVTGLSYGTTYSFKVKAQNGAGTDTAFGATASGTTGPAPLAAWDLTGATSVATWPATVFNANLDSANTITRGSGAAASAGNNSFRTVGFQTNGVSTANSDYFQVTLSVVSGCTLSLSSLDAQFNGTSTFAAAPGVTNQFAYSLDGTTFTLIGSPFMLVGGPVIMPPISLTGIGDLQNVPSSTTVYLRYYASGQTGTGGWGFYSPSASSYGLEIGGTVTGSALGSTTISNIVGTTLTYGGGIGTKFVLLKSANVAAPLSGWDRLLTNATTPGTFTIPAVGTGAPVFYRIKSE